MNWLIFVSNCETLTKKLSPKSWKKRQLAWAYQLTADVNEDGSEDMCGDLSALTFSIDDWEDIEHDDMKISHF